MEYGNDLYEYCNLHEERNIGWKITAYGKQGSFIRVLGI